MRFTIIILLCLGLGTPTLLAAQSQPPACADAPTYALLDFWVGEWDVYAGEKKVGENRIEKIVGGCAILEHWTDASGSEGKSLFYVSPDGTWKQVWVTEWARVAGGTKEKENLTNWPGPSVRFQGQIHHPEYGLLLDRTTLTPQDDGSVRQVIETSRDDGKSWTTSFDAVYRQRQERLTP